MTDLQQMFDAQVDLQIKAYGKDPRTLTGEERIQFIKDMHTAIGAELQEFLDETGWKPWATSRHVNEAAAQGELVDAWHFFMNLMMAVNLTPDRLHELYMAKRAKNLQRQIDGYDGIQGKCPRCRRALDDEAVECAQVDKDLFFCSRDSVDVDPRGRALRQ